MIIMYNKIISENDKKITDDNPNRNRHRNSSISKKKDSKIRSSKTINRKSTKKIKNNNELEPINEINGINLEPIDGMNGLRNNGVRRFTILTINSPNKVERYSKRLSSRNLLSSKKFTRETIEEEVDKKKSNEPKISDINSKEDIIDSKNEKNQWIFNIL